MESDPIDYDPIDYDRDVANAGFTTAAGTYLLGKTKGLPLYQGERVVLEMVGVAAINTAGAVGTTYIKNQMDGTNNSLIKAGAVAGISSALGYKVSNSLSSSQYSNLAGTVVQELSSYTINNNIDYINK